MLREIVFILRLTQTYRHHGPKPGQSGFTLIEAIAALVLCSTVLLAMITAVLAILSASDSHERVVLSGVNATDVAEQIERLPYQPCATVGAYQSQVAAISTPGFTFELLGLEYLIDQNAPSAGFTTTACTNNDQGIQRLIVRVAAQRASGSSASEDISFVKRNDTCPSNYAVNVKC